MSGQLGLGRVYNLVGAASGLGIKFRRAGAVGFLAVCAATPTGTLTVTAAKTYGGTYDNWSTANGFTQPAYWFQQTASGTAAWTKQTASWSANVLTIAGTVSYVSYVDFYDAMLPDGYQFIKVTAGANVSLSAIVHDLQDQAIPANLALLSHA